MYGIVSRIMRKIDAEKLGEHYKMLLNARIEEEMRETAMKKLNIEPSNVFESFGTSFVAYSLFVSSFNDLIETIRECREFESAFSDMDQKGLLSTLRLRDERLHSDLYWFHESSRYIVEETKDIADKLRTTTEVNDQTKAGVMSQSQTFQRIMMLNTHNLFLPGKSLEKRLRKYV
jgi:DNA-binding Lrp family transcriptional regulator